MVQWSYLLAIPHMTKRLTNAEFIAKAKATHGQRYDYSCTQYVNSSTKVEIMCRKHGVFCQYPRDHIRGCGCPSCRSDSMTRLLFGVGNCDRAGVSRSKCYLIWRSMLWRCYNTKFHERHLAYQTATCCQEWHTFSNFEKWFQTNTEYQDGYVLDKDILGRDYYSPDTCCFIPKSLSARVSIHNNVNGQIASGVVQCRNGTYAVYGHFDNKRVHLGSYRSKDEAHQVFVKAKTQYFHRLAERYYSQNAISYRVYKGLLLYQVPSNEH